MTDETTKRPEVESIPSRVGDISAIASGNAPFIYFDNFATFGFNDGIANISLTATRFTPANGQVLHDHVIVAHLRMSGVALAKLKSAIEGIEGLAKNPTNSMN